MCEAATIFLYLNRIWPEHTRVECRIYEAMDQSNIQVVLQAKV